MHVPKKIVLVKDPRLHEREGEQSCDAKEAAMARASYKHDRL